MMIDRLLLSEDHQPDIFISLCLRSSDQAKRTLHILLDYLASKCLDHLDPDASSSETKIAAAAGIIRSVIQGDESRTQEVVKWCTSSSGAGLCHRTAIRRAVLAALPQDKEAMTAIFKASLAQFGDQVYIRHAALIQQISKSPFCLEVFGSL